MNETETEPQNKQALAKKYSRIKQTLSVIETLIMFAVLLFLIFTGNNKILEKFSYSLSGNSYIVVLVFLGLIGFIESAISFPLDFYSGYILEHQYKLSNQSLIKYFEEKAKAAVLGLILGIPIALIFYFILKTYPDYWWIIFGVFMFIFSVLIARVAPIVIFPLFYKFRQIENEPLKIKIMELCDTAGVKVKGVFTFDISKNTKKANAAFTGLGKSKRIIIGDTLLDKFTDDEILSVFAHELGHYKKKHIIKMMAFSTIITFAGLYITSICYVRALPLFHMEYVYTISALPILFLFLSIFAIITSPIANIQSRKYEWQADEFALQMSTDKNSFASALEKLSEQNLADKQPNKIIEFLFHSHPSLQKRIDFARNIKQ
jgi:STE24 endopeptidase